MFRWEELTPKEKRIAVEAVTNRDKLTVLGAKFGMGRTYTITTMFIIYRTIGVTSRVELAFEIGKHWRQVSKELKLPPE